jgi:hypothetical protein
VETCLLELFGMAGIESPQMQETSGRRRLVRKQSKEVLSFSSSHRESPWTIARESRTTLDKGHHRTLSF